ncbi:MAG TPA: DUF305 domain-containing protein [Micromonosporaceae bacterium]
MRISRSRAGWAVATVAALTLVAGCGGTDGSSGEHGTRTTAGPSSADHNQADITFAQKMIVHHRQALEMAAMAESRAADSKVRSVAAGIERAQDPEIDQMTAWLREWEAPVPSVGGHDGHADMPGMMSNHDMAALAGASGADFDRMFLDMMIRHHEGAIEMARIQQQEGRNPAAKALAERIAADQAAEIEQLRALLDAK